METGVQNNLISGQLSVYIYLKIKNNFFFYLNLTSMKMLQTIKSLNYHQIKFLQKNAKRKEKKISTNSYYAKKIPLILYNMKL